MRGEQVRVTTQISKKKRLIQGGDLTFLIASSSAAVTLSSLAPLTLLVLLPPPLLALALAVCARNSVSARSNAAPQASSCTYVRKIRT